jgi:hypothetical protein
VVTAGSSAALKQSLRSSQTELALFVAMLGGVLGLLAIPGVADAQRKRHIRLLSGLLILGLVSIVLTVSSGGGSGGGGSSGGGGTPTGSYGLTVTGTFSSGSTKLTHSTNFTLLVQ